MQPLIAQDDVYKIIWLNADQQKLAGDISIGLVPNQLKSEFTINFSARWMDQNGQIISDDNLKPLIYLSESDIQIVSEGDVFCKTFTDTDQFDIFFNEKESLTFGFLPDIASTIEIRFIFKYAFSEQDIEDAKTYALEYPSANQVIYRIPLSSIKKAEQKVEKEIPVESVNPLILEQCNALDSCLLVIGNKTDSLIVRITEAGFQGRINSIDSGISIPEGLDSLGVISFKDQINAALSETSQYQYSLGTLKDELSKIEGRISSPLPPDSIRIYQSSRQALIRRVNGTIEEILNYKSQMRSLMSDIGIQVIPNDLPEQREIIRSTYLPSFSSHYEGLQHLLRQHEALVREDINPIITDLPSKAVGSGTLDSLQVFHGFLKDSLTSIKNAHRTEYLAYLRRINNETGPIAELDNLHLKYDEAYNILYQDIETIDSEILLFKRRVEEIETKQDYTLLWIGGSVLLLIIFIFLIREIRLNRKRVVEQANGFNGKKTDSFDFNIEDELVKGGGYFPFIVPESIESVVKEVHLSFRAIKSINQIVQGAISNKTAHAFGGFLFGYQYKTQGQGPGMYIVMIDMVVPSKNVRRDFVPGVNTNEDIVDEIDRVVGENKTKTLLGWFTATDNDDFLMSESLIKVHRTFFRDRWQTAMLIDPFSSDLNSAFYLRRKSGYFDPQADPNCHLSFDELYQYSLNPPIPSAQDDFVPDSSEYKRFEINGNWCDSVVQTVNFHQDVIQSIKKEYAADKIRLSNYEASAYFYGKVVTQKVEKNGTEFDIYISRYVDASNGEAPRDLPGFNLLGWFGLNDKEIFESLKTAIPFHSTYFKKSFQVSVIVNTSTMEMRFFSQKHSLEMNNNTIETEEFSLKELL